MIKMSNIVKEYTYIVKKRKQEVEQGKKKCEEAREYRIQCSKWIFL